MDNPAFFEQPILNSPYDCPRRHWELDSDGQPTQKIVESRRQARFITPIPKPKKRKSQAAQQDLGFEQNVDLTSIIGEVRATVDRWRTLPPNEWHVTPETARLLRHWRTHDFAAIRPFFCQIEAVETAIWLTEVAPQTTDGKRILSYLKRVNDEANPGLGRLALKLATGAGKTMVMAMLIAWQTVNSIRHPGSSHFTKGFLVITPGLTIRDRLRVLLPRDPDNYYTTRELVPADLMDQVRHARVVVTNYHAFKQRERMNLAAGNRALLQGRTGDAPHTTETKGQMLQRVMPELMGFKRILVLNDEAHHCYREKPADPDDEKLKGDNLAEAKANAQAARLWISGIEAVASKIGHPRIIDLSATPFFLRGSGYAEGTLFPWTMSDFSLMDAIECGIVKLPRVPVAENIPGSEMPMYRNLWENIRSDMPKKGRGKQGSLDPLMLPPRLQTALSTLYNHYEQTFKLWESAGMAVPPCFIVVCQNTSISKLVYDYISGFYRTDEDGSSNLENGRLGLFRNFDSTTEVPFAQPRTLLIDSEQLEAGDMLDKNFRKMAADEIERFRREIIERTGDAQAGEKISDQELLREVMNTVGKAGQLGAEIRCVVSVSMLTEGWDANNVTHIVGVRAFGTQLLCEQVVGRALRRQSYELTQDGLLDTEYADIFGIPFDFTAQPVVAPPQPPRETVQVRAVRPERDYLEIRFPRVVGYRVDLPDEQLTADFTSDSVFELTPALVGPTRVLNQGIIGTAAELNLDRLQEVRPSSVVYHLAHHLMTRYWRDEGQSPPLHLFGQLKRIARRWLDGCLICKGDTYPALLIYTQFADEACNRITAAITRSHREHVPIKAMLDPYNATGSTGHVRFITSKQERWDTGGPPPKNHVNWVVLDSDWEGELCRILESDSRVIAYTKNHSLGFEVPYRYGSEVRQYRPDFIALIEDGHGSDNLLHLVIEVKGYRGEDAKDKKLTMDTYWIPGVNTLKSYGRWAFVELIDVYTMASDLHEKITANFNDVMNILISD